MESQQPEEQRFSPAYTSSREGRGDRFVARLPAEVENWQSQGIITPKQGRAIIASYGPPGLPVASSRMHGRLVTILAVFGSVLIGLGVVLFFAANWQEIPPIPKLTLILVAIAAAYAGGYQLRYRRGYRRVGTAVILLASIFYGVGIHLVAQIYHVPVDDPNLFLYWFLGVLPLAYLTRSQAILCLGVALFLGAVAFRLPSWLEFASPDEVVSAFALYMTLGLMLYGLGKLQAQFDLTRSYARVYEIVGLVTTFGSLYILTFRGIYESGGRGAIGDIATGFWLAFYLAGAAALLFTALAAISRLRQRLPLLTLPYEAAAAALVLAAAYLVVLVPVGDDVFYPLLFNVLLLLATVGLLAAGYFQTQETWINLALVFFSVDAVTRYFEFSWTLFDRSFVFLIAGALLLGGGFLLERGRSKVFEGMRGARGVV